MDTLAQKDVVARKDRQCQSGLGEIKKGDTYERTTITFDGRIYDWKQCMKCKDAMSIPSDRDGLYEEERYPEGWAKEDEVGCGKPKEKDQ